MTDQIPHLPAYDDATLDASFAVLSEEVRATAQDADPEAFRLLWLGRKQGRLKIISEAWLKSAPPEARKPLGMRFNQLKSQIEAALEAPAAAKSAPSIDITLPGHVTRPRHPAPAPDPPWTASSRSFITLAIPRRWARRWRATSTISRRSTSPKTIPRAIPRTTLQIAGQSSKPSRDRLLMRTHTSPVQIRTMVAQAPPLRIVIPGKVHRNDAADATHSPIFHQVEGLCVDTDITFSDLKGTLDHAMRALFGSAVKTRFFPSFFPFTEPSADVQISCIFCNGKGCRKCKHSGWIELLGCGMVDPAVFEAVTAERIRLGLDPAPYDPARISGFAFGMGVERIAMILHGVSDIGQFYSGDLRFLEQFA